MKLVTLLLILRSISGFLLGPLSNFNPVDLSYPYDKLTIGWPEDRAYKLNTTHNGTTEEGYWYQADEIATGLHVGTHLDAPCHFSEGGLTLDQLPLDRFFGPAAVVDMTYAAMMDRDALLQVSDLQLWELRNRMSLDDTIVLVRTGWGSRWPNRETYLGNADNNVNNLHFPGVSKEAAQWLVNYRKIYGLGIDTASLDNGPSKDFPAHQTLLGASLYGMENVANLDKLPPFGAFLIVLPIKVKNASGGPVRIVAYLPN